MRRSAHSSARHAIRLVALLAAVQLAATPLAAQPATAPPSAAAAAAFESGTASYREGAYPEAYRLFRRAASEPGYSTTTTAALLMAGKAAYADADFDGAVSSLTTLIATYPQSRYTPEARRVLALATAGGPNGQGRPFDLGVVLPVSGANGYLGQALFNGVRIAVDEHNRAVEAGGAEGAPRRQVRLVFRDSGGNGPAASDAVGDAVEAGADAIVGPLFSDEAEPAAARAEAAGVVLVAPLATDDAVSAGRRFAFQANPTFAARGRVMARYTVQRLGLRRVGVVTQSGTPGETDGSAFAAEARRLGATVGFDRQLASAEDWPDLDRRVGASALAAVQAVYLPVTGADAPEHIAEAVRALEAVRGAPRPIGNTEWEGITTSRERASRMNAVFGQDFFVAPGASDAFGRRYRELSGIGPDRLALIGYDVTRMLLANLEPAPGQAGSEGTLADRLRAAPTFQGIAHRFGFGGQQVNESLFILGYRGGDAVLIE
ncbi:MAG TPA: ABC transporter substrate-binding protein [Rubricoccaceae bacterium]|jgi:ABC-type branched-subunit amino acid transport system substrate-binding protein